MGFDWPDANAVLDKFEEENGELRADLPGADSDRLRDEVGDLLFVLANFARKLELDPEQCLRQANDKFYRRFNSMEQEIEKQDETLSGQSLDRLEAAWAAVKRRERGL